MTYALLGALCAAVVLAMFVLLRRSHEHGVRQARLDAAFERARVNRLKQPSGLYGERAWITAGDNR